MGRRVRVIVDRPLGSHHPEHDDLTYPVNYGYVPGTRAGDGESIDAYVLGVPEPVATVDGNVVGVVRRADDAEDKLVVAPAGQRYAASEIESAVRFQERFFGSWVEVMKDEPGAPARHDEASRP